MTAPTLLTDRLRLDAHRADDLAALTALWADPAVHGLIGDGRPRPREEVWLRLLRSAGHWALLGYGSWVVRARADGAGGAALGEVGLLEAERAIAPPLDAPELGWALASALHGRGLMGEALAAVLGWADARGVARTLAIVAPANAPSLRLAARAGFRPAGTRRYQGRPVALLARAAAAPAA